MQNGIAHSRLVFDLLNLSDRVPLTLSEMAHSLNVTFYPPHQESERLSRFADRLRDTLDALGVNVIPYDEALDPSNPGKVRPGIVIVEQGEGKTEDLAINRVPGLYQNPLVSLREGSVPIPENADLQTTLDTIVGVLAWNLTHVPIFVGEKSWDVCTMNGAVIRFGDWENMQSDVLHSLIPKLTAQVVPPKASEILYREGNLDIVRDGYAGYVDDFLEASKVWKRNGFMLAHTSIDALRYRNPFYRRIVAAYLDHRTGMSYGFMAYQLPVAVEPAVPLSRLNGAMKGVDWDEKAIHNVGGRLLARVEFLGETWIVPIPDVWLLSTRSGCNKTRIDPHRDIVRMGLVGQQIVFETPVNVTASECRPSYDTLAILAHALGNVIVAGLLSAFDPDAEFSTTLQNHGLSVSHWHGYLGDQRIPEGYLLHGSLNPPVSCSTPQSAVFALSSKLQALEGNIERRKEYRGDVHVEPHHGTNMTGCLTLTQTAAWVDRMGQAPGYTNGKEKANGSVKRETAARNALAETISAE